MHNILCTKSFSDGDKNIFQMGTPFCLYRNAHEKYIIFNKNTDTLKYYVIAV